MGRSKINICITSAGAALLAILLQACASSAPEGPILLHPLPVQLKDYRLDKGAVTYETEDLLVSARPFDWRLVEDHYRGKELTVPFGKGDELGEFVFFCVLIENRSQKTLTFNPLMASLYNEAGDFSVPVELSDLYLLSSDDEAREDRVQAFKGTHFDGSTSISPDETIERFLVFPLPSDENEKLKLLLNELYIGFDSSDLNFLFEAFPGREEE